jgi:pyruvate kinase
MNKRTKIVCTIGPASSSEEKIRALIEAGMNVARLNFSHGTHEDHAEVIQRIRTISAELDVPIAILQDLQGPKIRVGVLPKEGVELAAGEQVIFTTGEASIGDKKLPVTYDKLHEDVKAGERILLDDGLLSATVVSVKGKDVICKVIDGGLLTSHKGVNFPETKLTVSAITDKDKDDLRFGVSQKVDWVALSFVRSSKELFDLRYLIKGFQEENGGTAAEYPIRIIAKMEKPDAIKNMEEIIEATDGIMVARGDLGIEMRAEEVPLIQKRLIDACRVAAKPVIVATQMLDSMIRNPRPTRAEVSDIANAVIDHTDAVMLSGETASGKYPIESVEMMARVILQTEASHYDDVIPRRDSVAKSTEEAITEVASILARDVKAKLILVASMSGDTARLLSRYRPELPIAAATSDARVQYQMNLSWNVRPFLLPRCSSVEELIDRSIGYLKKKKTIKAGEKIIIVAGEPVGGAGANLVEIRDI